MKKATVLRFYGTEQAVADALGIARQAVNQWRVVVPELTAYKLQVVSRGKVKVDLKCYAKKA